MHVTVLRRDVSDLFSAHLACIVVTCTGINIMTEKKKKRKIGLNLGN